MTFGEYTKAARLAVRLTLRAFSRQIGMDPSNWSKIERGVIPPPANDTQTSKIAEILKLSPEQKQELEDLAVVARGELPKNLDDAALLAKMPAFFRALKGREYTAEDLKKLTERIKDLNTP